MDKQDVASTHDNDSFRAPGEEEHAQCGETIVEVKLEEGQHERRQRLLRQAFKVFLSSLGMWSMGSMFSFASVMASDLENNNTTIYGTPISLTNTQMDMMSSILVSCTLPGALLLAPLMVLFGRKPCMMISGVLLILGWLGVVFLPGVAGIMVGRTSSDDGFWLQCQVLHSGTHQPGTAHCLPHLTNLATGESRFPRR